MNKLCVIILLVTLANAAFGMNIRNKRQTEDAEDSLDDRYGWFRPSWQYPTQRPERTTQPPRTRFPNQWPFPNQYPDPGFYPRERLFPNQGQLPDQGQTPNQGLLITTQNPTDGSTQPSTTMSPENNPTVQACISGCPVTPEYNPVCGSNGVTYPNPGRLLCAQACGVPVNQLRSSPCPPAPTAAPV